MKIHKRHLNRTEHATSIDQSELRRVVVAEVARQLGLDLEASNVTYHCTFTSKAGASIEPVANVIIWLDQPQLGR